MSEKEKDTNKEYKMKMSLYSILCSSIDKVDIEIKYLEIKKLYEKNGWLIPS